MRLEHANGSAWKKGSASGRHWAAKAQYYSPWEGELVLTDGWWKGANIRTSLRSQRYFPSSVTY